MDSQAEIRQQDGECSLALEGRLDYSNTVNFHSRCNSLIAMPEASRVILDCGKLTYIDSSGIGALMGQIAEAELPLPLTTINEPAFRFAKEAFYEAGAQIAHIAGARF